LIVDAGPLIYLAKLEALDVSRVAGHTPLVTPEVERETARPGLAYVYPDALLVAEALRNGVLTRTVLSEEEHLTARRLAREAGGLDAGEAEVLAAAASRSLPVLLFERQAVRLARSLGLDTWSPIRLLLAGTPDSALLRERLVGFARLVSMRIEDVETVIQSIEEAR
jgi:predicted nucleic acid-binding protein